METGEEPPSPSPSPFRASSSSIFRDISNFKTPKQGSRKPSFYQTPGTQFFTASKQTPRDSSSSSSVRRRASLAPSSSRARTARRLKALEVEQSQSSRKVLVQKERSLKSLAKSITVWLNFLFENPGSCGCNLSTGGGNGDGEVSAKGKRDSLPGIGVRVDAAWRNPKRQRDSAWRADDGEHGSGFSSSVYTSLQNSLKDVCSFEDLKRRMRVYLSLGGCKEVFDVMTQVAKNIDEGRLKMKAHCPLVTDVGLKQKATKILMCYNPVWLRIGLYIVFGGDSLLFNGDADSDHEITFLRMIIEKQFFLHAGLAKAYAYNKMVEGLYRPGYYETLGNIILKRLLLLVLVLDRAKSQSSLSLKYGIDGVDGGSPLLFTVQSRIKSSRQVIQDFLSSDVMLGEGNVLAHLMIVGYKVSYQQNPLVEYDFQISDLFVDLKDGVRLGRATHLLLDDSSILTKLVIPSDTSKKHLANCGVVLQYLRQAGVSLCDDDEVMIVGDDIANGDKELTLSLLWNIFVHLQLPHLMKQTLLVEEIYKIRGDTMDNVNTSSSTPLELLLRWIQAICQNYNCRVDNFSSLVDGKAIWCLLDYYFRKELPCSCSAKDSCRSTGEESIVLVTDYPDAVHNFLLSQRLTTLLGNFPEVLQISDILEYSGACNDRSVVILLVFLASQLIVKKNMDQLNFHKLLGCPYQSPTRKLSSIEPCSSSPEVVGYKDETCDHTTEDAARKFKAVQAWWREMTERNYQSVTQPTAPILQDFSLKQNIINIQRETAAKTIQSHFRRAIKRRNYVKMIKAASLLQTVIRAWLIARKKPSSTIFGATQLQGFSCERWKGSETWERYGIFIIERHSFVKLKKSVLFIQRSARNLITWRRQLSSARTSVASSLNLISASIVIQKYFRGWLARSRKNCEVVPAENAKKGVDDLVNASIIIQKYLRGWFARSRYINEIAQIEKAKYLCPKKSVSGQINASIVIQKYFRRWLARSRYICEVARVDKAFNLAWKKSVDDLTVAAVNTQLAWKNYSFHSRLQNEQFAATKLQSHFRCWLLRRKYQNQKRAILKIQSNFRMSRCLKTYERYKTLVMSAIVIQSFVRQCICHREACRRKHMIIVIQRHFRGWLVRREFLSQREAATMIQSAIRGQNFRKVVECQRHAASEIQRFVRGEMARKRLLGAICLRCGTPCGHILGHSKGCNSSSEIKLEVSSALKVQRWWRRVMSLKLKTESAVVIQSHIRGCIARRKATREVYSVLRLQRWWRGFMSHKLTKSAVVIQSHVRGWIARKKVTREFCSALKLQRWWRGVVSVKLRTQSAVVIQSHIRGWTARRKVTREFCSVLKLQRWWRGVMSLKLRTSSVVVIQSHIRGWIARRKVTRERHHIVVIQSHWKGYLARKASRGQLLDLRLRMEKTAANVDDGMRIINRLIAAVSELLSKKSISGILHTCATLDMATQYSQKCCEELVKARAIDTLLELIRSVSRSIPDQEVLKHALSTLRNLARYPHLVEVLIECRGSTETILLQQLRNKEEVYFIASDLMRKICSSPKGIEAVRKSPALLKRLHNLVDELTRKAYNEKRNVRGPIARETTDRRLREAIHLLKMVTEG